VLKSFDFYFQVRSFEEGFLGSWHPGTVIHCEKLRRYVRYENILNDDGLSNFVEVVTVSSVLDGNFGTPSKRGVIRPLPPLVEFEKCDLKYGLCVDVNYQEAWWEGVVYDHCDGMEERSVFFPDLGDEMKVGIHQMRITQDWDEVTEKWEQRGKWLFLELIEECEQESYVPVSVKQIWYDVRQKEEFSAIEEWTLNVKKDLWRDMIAEVVGDYLAITLSEVFSALNLPELNLVELISNVDSNMTLSEKENFEQRESVLPVEKDLPVFQNEVSCNRAGEAVLVAIGFEKNEHGSPTYLNSNRWERVIFSETEYCPDAVKQYALASNDKTTMASLKEKVLKHLVYLGWEIDVDRCNKHYRYKPPPGDHCKKKLYYSLIELCKVMQMESMHPTSDCLIPDVPLNALENIQNQDASPLVADEQAPPSVAAADEQAYCPQAIVEYHKRALEAKWKDKSEVRSKVKRHLLAEGWTLIDPPPNNRRRGVVYISPQERRFHSLIAVCEFYVEEIIPRLTISGMQPSNRPSHLLPQEPELHTIDTAAVNKSSANRKRKHFRNSDDSSPKCQSNESTLRVLRSNKRVREASSSCMSNQKPLNVLSWLIDSNVVLPRSKVYYRAKRGQRVQAGGRITHEGIKCICCSRIYSLVSFEFHATGINTTRPSASIFLDDGRSLLSCQMQIMQDHKSKEAMVKPLCDLRQGENDYICSVCHYGGELLLCDQCPSSYHNTCLGLEVG
jgi:hypothetical protein